MAKSVNLSTHLSASELKASYISSSDPVESRRYHLLWLVSQGYQLTQAAQVVGYNYNYAYKVVRRYNEEGVEGVKNGRKSLRPPGRKGLLDEQQLADLSQQIQSPPEDGGLWTGPKVARWIEKVTGQEKVWNQRGWDYLKKIEYSWQRPRPRHEKANAEAQEEFKKNSQN